MLRARIKWIIYITIYLLIYPYEELTVLITIQNVGLISKRLYYTRPLCSLRTQTLDGIVGINAMVSMKQIDDY